MAQDVQALETMSLTRFEHGAIVAELTETALDVARRMRDFHVGSVVITRGARVVGIVTDRDLVVRILAEGRDPHTTLVADIVTYDPTTLDRNDGVETALRKMREHGVRRLPIINYDGTVTGIVTADDLLVMLSQQLSDLGASVGENIDAADSR